MRHGISDTDGKIMGLDELEKSERRWRQRSLFKDRRTSQWRLPLLLIALAATALLYLLDPSILEPLGRWFK